MIYNVKDFGAIGDASTLNTSNIQKAIDTCGDNGGGQVLLADGVFLTGSIRMRSNTELHIEANATLLASSDYGDYPERADLKHVVSENLPRNRNACLIFAEDCENIALTGMGKIDCNGENYVVKKQGEWKGWEYERIPALTPPRVVFFTGCRNIIISDITMLNQPAGWSYWIHDCDYVTCRGLKIIAEVNYPNNDGIHINSSRNVTVSDCDITCGDDCIIVRANNRSLSENKICEKVTVTNCNLTSYSAGIRIAWTRDGVIKNCIFSNIVMTDTTVGIAIVVPDYDPRGSDYGREKTLIKNLRFNSIVMDGIYGRPVRIHVAGDGEWCAGIEDIYFDNINCKALEFPYLHGAVHSKINNIVFSNCVFRKVSDEELPNYHQHGAASWDRRPEEHMIKFAENIVFNNTVFKSNE